MTKKGPPRKAGRFVVSRGRTSCYYCRCSFDWDDPRSEFAPTREHKQPRSKGGRNHGGNVVLACYRCNQEKGAMTLAEFREYLDVTKGCSGPVARRLRWKKHKGLMRFQLNEVAPLPSQESGT